MPKKMVCASCKQKKCTDGKDCLKSRKKRKEPISKIDLQLLKAAAETEAEYYMKATRLEELIVFSKKMGYKRLGIAFCIGLEEEARLVDTILRKHFKVSSAVCKVGGKNKKDFGLKQIHEGKAEVMCDPIRQAELMNEDETDLNIIVGLCIGHDILFTKHSKAPVTTFAVKDRLLCHNPLGAVYSRYHRTKRFGLPDAYIAARDQAKKARR